MFYNKNEVNCAEEIVKFIAEYFGYVFKPLPDVQIPYHSVENLYDGNYLSNIQLTSTEILNSLKCVDVNKVIGTDGMKPVFVRNCADGLTYPLQFIFNRSLSSSIFPNI